MRIVKYQKYLIAVVFALCAPLVVNAQQNSLTQTTLSAAVAGNIQGQGTTPLAPAPVLIQVASATGIVGINPNLGVTATQPNQSALYIDREEMYVLAVNGTVLTVVRGVNGTVASPHSSGVMVLVGKPTWFYAFDPGGTTVQGGGSNVSCVLANVVVTPWVNVRTGGQWVCSALTLTWAPSWNNALSSPATWIQTGTIASVAGATAVSGPYFNISGTNAITSFTIPLGFDTTKGGCFTANPTGIWTWTAAGNIATAGTTTAATTPVTFCWNVASSKWIPSRLS